MVVHIGSDAACIPAANDVLVQNAVHLHQVKVKQCLTRHFALFCREHSISYIVDMPFGSMKMIVPSANLISPSGLDCLQHERHMHCESLELQDSKVLLIA